MRNWLMDGPLRSVLRNAGYLGSTKIIGALFGIVALSCAGRALGPELFGVLTLIHTYALGANALTNFQSWQVVIRYGSPALARGDDATAGAAISLSFGLDLASGLFGMVAGMLLLPLVASRFGISGDWTWVAIAYCTLHHMRPGLRRPAALLPGSWNFVWTTNMSTSLGAGWGPIGNLVIGALLGPAAAGVYKVATTLLDAAGKPADMLSKGFYPEIMRLDPHGPEPWRLGLRSGTISGIVGVALGLVVVLASDAIIDAIFGHRYLPAGDILAIMTVALAISMASFPFQSLLYMAGRQADALTAQAVATAIYLIVLVTLCVTFGLPGAAMAYVVGNLVVAGIMGMYVHLSHSRLRGQSPKMEAAA